MQKFVERRPAGFYLIGTRVPIDCIVREYWNGEPEESIRAHYPTLSLEQVRGAIAFYLANRDEVDAVIAERERIEAQFRAANPPPPELKEKLDRARQLHAK